MQKFLKKIKPIGLLLGLSIFAIGVVWIVNQFKGTNDFYSNVSQGLAEAVSFVDETAGATPVSEISPEKVQEGKPKQVLAASDKQCAQAINNYDSVEICTTGGNKVDYTVGEYSGGYVRKNAEIYLSNIYIPMVLLSGSKTVENSNRKITSETGTYKPAGEQFTEKEANVERYPNEGGLSYVEDKAFSTKYSVAFSQAEDSALEGDVVISQKMKNNCEYCNNKSNTNPDKTNEISEFLYNSRMKTPGENNQDSNENTDIESCSQKDTFREIESSTLGCKLSLIESISVRLKQLISAPILDTCKLGYSVDEDGNRIPPDDDCIRTEDIVVKISSMFGSDYKCEDGVCTNAYMTARNKVALSPMDSSNYSDNVYYLTPCTAYVDGRPTTVRCAWDLSYLFKERKVSEYDDIGSESTPSKSAYDQYLLEEAGSRKDETVLEMK